MALKTSVKGISALHHSTYGSGDSYSSDSKLHRAEQADAAGLKGEFRDQYINSARKNTYRDTFWDRVKYFFGGKLGSEAVQESLDLEDQAMINQLLNAQREQEYNSEEAQAARLRAAGVNPDLDGGASLSPSEASQIDDEVFGSGLKESLTATQGQASEIQANAAELFMNAATSILGLANGGLQVSNLLRSQDWSELGSMMDYGSKIIDYLYNPTSVAISGDPYFDKYKNDDGSYDLTKVDWDRYYREKFGIRSKAVRNQIRHMAKPYNTPRYLVNLAESDARASGADAELVDNVQHVLEKTGFGSYDSAYLSPNGSSMVTSLLENPTYKQFVENSAKLQLESMRSGLHQQKMLAEYYEELNKAGYGKKKALKESFLQTVETEEAHARLTAAQQVNSNIEWLVQRSEQKDWMATLLLQSIISGSFQSYGLGNPMDIPMWIGDKVTGLTGDLLTFLKTPKGAAKAATKAAPKAK